MTAQHPDTTADGRASAAHPPILRVDSLTVGYGAIRALIDVSFELQQGEFLGVLGSNGAGKSTLLKTISGLLKPERGSISFGGRSLHGLSAYQIPAVGIAHVPERRRVFPSLSVLDNLRLGGYKVSRADRDAGLEEIFGVFPRLAERRAQLAGSLSGGEQQMLAVGRALMLHPRLLMLDEPSLGLAPVIVEEMFAKLAQIHRDTNVSILLIEQNATQALEVIERGVVLSTGRVTFEGSRSELSGSDFLREAYLGI
ncbi:branched-chain amino acid transport system ATP-binding protein [Antricoccus suffuscus]|uniref:Branched-chain amino acid transport system ATP-binding protein n=1 Tax=Antricoccus suffuscus TaxID=1629062 RepID=A0A2T1A1A4_9ACTN|nr:ABC transporter ATP-binding protein [Antricoccus suffuscus]PRZ42314.1 branched-chain amino acid transport system ATP-binding protein [Antricoccus suffuscus]